MINSKRGLVYVATVRGKSNLCKIGYTKLSPEKRVSELRRDYKGMEFDLAFSIESDEPKKLEAMIHRFIESKIYEREIFNITTSSAIRVCKAMVGRKFTVTTPSNMYGFNCIGGEDLFHKCNENRELASKAINKACRHFNVAGTTRIGNNDISGMINAALT